MILEQIKNGQKKKEQIKQQAYTYQKTLMKFLNALSKAGLIKQ